MSYSRRYTTQIAVHYSGSVSYPASQNGGSTSYSGTAYENVTIDIDVHTGEFDAQISNCRNSVDNLTSSVYATEIAQVNAIRDSSRKISNTIVRGFFDTVRSEISQQISELTSRLDSTVIHLNQMAERCQSKHQQMQTDYGRLTSRYSKIFDDLNHELENRIYELSRSSFQIKRSADNQVFDCLSSDMSTTATISATENSILESRLAASVAKSRAQDTINQAFGYLAKQKQTEYVLAHSTIDSPSTGNLYLPVCYIETDDNGVKNRSIHKPQQMLSKVDTNDLIARISQSQLDNTLQSSATQLEENFSREVSASFNNQDAHNKRVMDYVTKLFYSNIKK